MKKNRTKILSFNAQVAVTAEQIWEGLRDVEISHGPAITAWEGYWGQIQIWAASWPDGAALMERVCALAAIPWGPEARGDLIFTIASNPDRYRPGIYRVKVRKGLAFVSSRPGPEGLPEYPLAKAPRSNPLDPKGSNRLKSQKRYKLRIEQA